MNKKLYDNIALAMLDDDESEEYCEGQEKRHVTIKRVGSIDNAISFLKEDFDDDLVCSLSSPQDVRKKFEEFKLNREVTVTAKSIEAYQMCQIHEQMLEGEMYIIDRYCYPHGRVLRVSEIQQAKINCINARLGDSNEVYGAICRPLTATEIRKLFSDRTNLPEYFHSCTDEYKKTEDYKLDISGLCRDSINNLFISEDNKIFAEGKIYSKILEKQIIGLRFDCSEYEV